VNFPFYIAKRYAASSAKRKNIINIISVISIIAIAMGSMALVILLSVFNGIESLVISMMNTFDTPLKIEAAEGKHFPTDSTKIAQLEDIPSVLHVVEVIEENALSEYDNLQHIVRVKGVSPNYQTFTMLDSMLIDGKFLLEQGDLNYTVMGAGVWYFLGVNIRNYFTQLTLIAPQRTSKSSLSAASFNRMNIIPSGVFSVQQELDETYVIVPLRFAAKLFNYDSLRSYYEVWTVDDKEAAKIKQQVADIVGHEFKVLDRFEQQKTLYKVMRSEKWAVYLILSFIVLIAAFNMISSISMLIVDKEKDMYILNAMGSSIKNVRYIFLWQGLLQSTMGVLIGIVAGLFSCYLQIIFGIIPLGSEGGSFIVDYYPVVIKFWDIVFILITIIAIGFITSLIPVLRINNSYFKSKK
jgi:lipoprotein-releasing system permease protein